MDALEVRELIREELPRLLEEDPETKDLVLRLTRDQFADRKETESRFDQVLAELQREREAQERKWEEQNQKWWENQRALDEQNRKREEQNQRLREEQAQHRAEQDRKWWENQRAIDATLAEIRRLDRRIDQRLGAMGARWGRESESAFRAALRAILEESFGVQVINVIEFDDEGEVHGRPDQVELDLIIRNGELIICELKSSISKSDLYAFYRGAKFYERRHQRQATRLIAISPMVDRRALRVAQQLGIEVYSFADDVPIDDAE